MTDLARGRELEARCALTPYSESNYRAWSKWLHTNSPALLSAAERVAALEEALRMLLIEVQSPRVPLFVANRDTWEPVVAARRALAGEK